ncbi:MAG: hypothetical protein ACNA8W_06315 [Bradymonadaceae bacterium]
MQKNIFSPISLLLIVLFAMLALGTACSKDPEVVTPPRDVQTCWEDCDVEESPPDADAEPVEEDVETRQPGFLHGDWEMRDKSDDRHIQTFHLVHFEGEETVTGTFTLCPDDGDCEIDTGEEDTPRGRLSPGIWRNNTSLDISWTRHIQGGDRTFSLFDATRENDDLLADGTYNDTKIFHNYPVDLKRKP